MLLELFDQTGYRADYFGSNLFLNLPWRNFLKRSQNDLLTMFIDKNVANIHRADQEVETESCDGWLVRRDFADQAGHPL